MNFLLMNSNIQRNQKQNGQALTEFLVLAVALVPLFLLIPVIAKYQDISHATQMASRYVAFESTIRNEAMSSWKPEAQLADEVRRRFFSNSEAPIKTNDVAGDFDANRKAFWRQPGGKPLIERFSDVTVSFGNDFRAHHSDAFVGDDGTLGYETAATLSGLNRRDIYRANVSVKLANLPAGLKMLEPFDRIDLSMTRSTAVLFDAWGAKGTSEVEDRVKRMSPIDAKLGDTVVEDALGLGIQLVDFGLPHPTTPTFSGGVKPPEFGRVDKWRDFVPPDRLIEAEPAPRSGGG
jgi:hypothetical protein